jgi:hypothetical protein
MSALEETCDAPARDDAMDIFALLPPRQANGVAGPRVISLDDVRAAAERPAMSTRAGWTRVTSGLVRAAE